MALHVKALNNESSFLLTFIPSVTPADQKYPEAFPGAFTILIDPWLGGSAQPANSKTSRQQRRGSACVASLDELPEPDLVLVSQTTPEHCHEETLRQLSPDAETIVAGPPAVAKKILKWGHWDSGDVHALDRFTGDGTAFRIEIPPPSSYGTPGEVNIALLAGSRDLTGGVHNAIGITYRAPVSVLAQSLASIPVSPQNAASTGPTTPNLSKSRSKEDYVHIEPTISLLYSPHGVALEVIQPWANFLATNRSFPPLAFIHSTTVVNAPWYLSKSATTGFPGGLPIAQALKPMVWIAASDEEMHATGLAGKKTNKRSYDLAEAQMQLDRAQEISSSKRKTKMLRLESGETLRMDQTSFRKLVESRTDDATENRASSDMRSGMSTNSDHTPKAAGNSTKEPLLSPELPILTKEPLVSTKPQPAKQPPSRPLIPTASMLSEQARVEAEPEAAPSGMPTNLDLPTGVLYGMATHMYYGAVAAAQAEAAAKARSEAKAAAANTQGTSEEKRQVRDRVQRDLEEKNMPEVTTELGIDTTASANRTSTSTAT